MATDPLTLIGTLAHPPEVVSNLNTMLFIEAGEEELQLVYCRGRLALEAARLEAHQRVVLRCVVKDDVWEATAIERAAPPAPSAVA